MMTATASGQTVEFGPVATDPGGPAADSWVSVARDLAAQLAAEARGTAAGRPPLFEMELFRDAGLLTLLGPESAGGQARPYAVALAVIRELAQVDSGLARVLAYHYAWAHRLGTDLIRSDRYVEFERRVTENRWLVGSTGSPLDPDLTVIRTARAPCGSMGPNSSAPAPASPTGSSASPATPTAASGSSSSSTPGDPRLSFSMTGTSWGSVCPPATG